MDWRMLIRRCPSRSFTIVGDVAQTSALGGTRSWRRMMDPLFGERNWQLNELTINYRNPKEVSAARQRFRLVRRPVHLHGERRAWRPGFSQASHLA